MSNVAHQVSSVRTPTGTQNRRRVPGFLTIGHAFTKDGVRVDVVRRIPGQGDPSSQRMDEEENNELLKGVSDEV